MPTMPHPYGPQHRKTSSPATGPRLLFFSGGTALKNTSQQLTGYTHNSIHILPPFDSGGSSASLRRFFQMPAVGDLRNRLLALADQEQPEFSALQNLFDCRFALDARQELLYLELQALGEGTHPLLQNITKHRTLFQHHFRIFLQEAGQNFPLAGASLGNLLLTAAYLEHSRCMTKAVAQYAAILKTHGKIHLCANVHLHLQALLHDGSILLGQHLFTGKECLPIQSPIQRLSLATPDGEPLLEAPNASSEVKACIRTADLICYPIGSFYSSVIANLLPRGITQAIAEAPCPKICIPNTFPDPESFGLSAPDQIDTLLHYLQKDVPGSSPTDMLSAILLDPDLTYPGQAQLHARAKKQGITCVHSPFADRSTLNILPKHLCQTLWRLPKELKKTSGFSAQKNFP